MYSKTR
nr:unknown [Zea mays]